MIDEYDKHYWLLSCDLCGITEAGPFYDFWEAVQYKKDNPEEWKSLFLQDEKKGKGVWKDVCAGCFPKTHFSTWTTLPESKRPKKVTNMDDIPGTGASIADVLKKRRKNL